MLERINDGAGADDVAGCRNPVHPWMSFLHEVRQPSRYAGGEFGTALNAEAPNSIALVFPDVYEVGMSHLGTQILYSILAAQPDIRVERAFSVWIDMEAELRRRGMPLVSLESWRPLASFDVLGFSLQHELCYTNVLAALDLSGIPLRAADRGDSDPVILGGGPCVSHAEPMAPFFDAFFIGEAEASIAGIVRLVGSMRREGAPRRSILERLAGIPGVFVPALYVTRPDPLAGWLVPEPAFEGVPARVRRVFIPNLEDWPIPVRTIMPWNRAIFDRVSIEIARGCSEGCRFCEAGFSYRPLRDRNPGTVLRDSLAAIAACGYEEVSLGALSPADYPALPSLVAAMSGSVTPRNVTLSVSSLRAYGLSEAVLKDMKAVRAAGLTLAPEAGSQRLRDVINKNITEQDMLDAAGRAFGAGWQRLKLYFMLGLPTETDDDVAAIVELARKVLKVGRGHGRADVNAAVGVFVPRPHTPFQWEGMADPDVVARRQAIIREASRRTGVTFKYPDQKISRLECVMARGDRSLADVVQAAFEAGCRFDNWTETFSPDLWDAAFLKAGVDRDMFLREVPAGAALPWQIADMNVSVDFLARERVKAFEAVTTRPCEKPLDGLMSAASFDSGVVCHACGTGCRPRELAKARGTVAAAGDGLAPVIGDEPIPPPSGWHIVYTRSGASSWLSQIDLVKHVPRIFKRAGYEPVFSGGFHPMPKFSYCEPMAVGYRSVGEWVDARLHTATPPDPARLNEASIDGMVFLSVEPMHGRRAGFRPTRFAFSCPVPPEEATRLLGELDGGRLLEMPAGLEHLCPSPFVPGENVWTILWPGRAARPAANAYDWLSGLMGRRYLPSDLVRLYDCPIIG
ncbi:TIGR03960 family B12-binding radical SAM protein [Myxococcota bacterium]|nr:TIGR03960 family B12-binding radical SAM protein [Myxococcota bacterium]